MGGEVVFHVAEGPSSASASTVQLSPPSAELLPCTVMLELKAGLYFSKARFILRDTVWPQQSDHIKTLVCLLHQAGSVATPSQVLVPEAGRPWSSPRSFYVAVRLPPVYIAALILLQNKKFLCWSAYLGPKPHTAMIGDPTSPSYPEFTSTDDLIMDDIWCFIWAWKVQNL